MMSCCLNSITDLRSVGFGQSVPEQSLWLLRWFASEIDIDINGDISLTFDPNSFDYGSHHYRNDEQLLDPLPWGYQYYSLGNIHQQGSLRLPHYVTHPQSEHEYGNRARIIIRVWEPNHGRRFFLDPINLLMSLRDDSQLSEERNTRNTWGYVACLGLLLFTVMQENHSSHNRRQNDWFTWAGYSICLIFIILFFCCFWSSVS
uniref:Uncharacterized protein n=1 Tax=Astatotilapia calliptera TaxID=8154 RepID=A0A3P8N7L9_ASTCA